MLCGEERRRVIIFIFESVFFNDAQRDVSRRLGGGGVGTGSGRWGREEEGS